MRYLILSVFLILFLLQSNAQPIFPYWDKYNSHFNVYDNGQLKTLEILQPKSYKYGANLCAYVTDILDFKVYTEGKSRLVSKFVPRAYECSDVMVVWNTGVNTNVYYDGQTKKLANESVGFTLNDSIVTYTDRYGYFMVYYDHKSTPLEIMPKQEYMNGSNYYVGRNLVAFEDRSQQMKVFFHDTLVTLEYFSDSLLYQCGLNTIGFLDPARKLKVFYNKNVFTLDKLRPLNFKVGDDMVAWVDQNNNFKVFHKGNIFILENYIPSTYEIVQGVLYYKTNKNELKVFENGKGRVIENYYPTQLMASRNTLAYLDFRNRLKVYDNGQVFSASEDIVNSFTVMPGLVIYFSNAKSMTFWYREEKIEVQLN
jgi:hypothetical protein